MSNPSSSASQPLPSTGLIFGVLAYGSWGILPIYWKLLGEVSALEVLCHRLIWSTLLLLGIISLRQQLPALVQILRSPRLLLALLGTAILLACNWGTYIYGVNLNRVVETSLGYFMNPLISTLLGCIVLRERLTRLQGIAVGLAAVGVGNFVLGFGSIPWIALTLASSFAFYGLCRKLIPVSPLLGIAVETLVLTPVAFLWLGQHTASTPFGEDINLTGLLILSGLVTSFPLFCFNRAAKSLPLSTLGFLQYLAPSLQLLLGVFLYGESFTPTHAISFGFIWGALGLYSVYLWRLSSPKPA